MWTDAYPRQVLLKAGRHVTIRLLQRNDNDALLAFFGGIPEQDRVYLQHDVTDPALIGKWTKSIDLDRAIPLVAEDEGKIVADGTLHLSPHGWARHVGQIRLLISTSHRHLGLGTLLARELVQLAEDRNLEKLYANVIEDDAVSIKLLQRLGFKIAATLKDLVKDQHGKTRNLLIMVNDVAEVGRLLEDWIQDTMVSAYRVPGGMES